MTIKEFRDLLLTADPEARHYTHATSGNYTVWSEYNEVYGIADDQIASKVAHIQVDRYTRLEYDPMVDTITHTLDEGGVLVIDRRTLFEMDSGYIHHIWDCELMP